MPPDHGHVVNVPRRTLLCVCRPCYLLFTHEGAGGLTDKKRLIELHRRRDPHAVTSRQVHADET